MATRAIEIYWEGCAVFVFSPVGVFVFDYGLASAGERTFAWPLFSAACFRSFLSNLQEIFGSRESNSEFPAYSSRAKYGSVLFFLQASLL